MKRQNKVDKLTQKRETLVERTGLVLGVSNAEAEKLLATPRRQGLRINTLKADDAVLDELKKLGWKGKPYDWAPNGYTISAGREAVRDSKLVKNGQVYIQNAASWLPVLALDLKPGERILDAAAAPGGKASHIAAITENKAELWTNDNSRSRLEKMRVNFERLGVEAEFTLYDARFLSKRFGVGSFDKILLDAPCSGEGLIDINNPKTLETWSVAAIKRLQTLQRRLISESWRLLKPGGTLVYSTCTMAPEENELVVDWLLKRQSNAAVEPLQLDDPARVPVLTAWNDKLINEQLQGALRLKPSGELEAFFICKLTKWLTID